MNFSASFLIAAFSASLACIGVAPDDTPEPDPAANIATAVSAATTTPVGPFNGQPWARTNFATKSGAVTCRAASISPAAYDAFNHTTYIAYTAGTAGPSSLAGVDSSAENPYIIAYNHDFKTWSEPVLLDDVYTNSKQPGRLLVPECAAIQRVVNA